MELSTPAESGDGTQSNPSKTESADDASQGASARIHWDNGRLVPHAADGSSAVDALQPSQSGRMAPPTSGAIPKRDELPGPCWAPDPWNPSGLRYWDGETWTGFALVRKADRAPVTWGRGWRRSSLAWLALVVTLSAAAGGTSGGWTAASTDHRGCPTAWSFNPLSFVLWGLAAAVAVAGALIFLRQRAHRASTDRVATGCVFLATLTVVVLPEFVFVMGFNMCWI